MDEDTRSVVDGFGARLNDFGRVQASCGTDKDVRLKHIERWTQDQEDKLNKLESGQKAVELRVVETSNEIVTRVTARFSLISAAMMLVLGALMFLK